MGNVPEKLMERLALQQINVDGDPMLPFQIGEVTT
jgi:hypothetical protein